MDGICPFAEWVPGVTAFSVPVGVIQRAGYCDHTAGGFFTTLETAGFWNTSRHSVHFAIGRRGQIAQLVNIFDTAWAQGQDALGGEVGPNSPGVSWPPFAKMGRRNPNEYLISTEHEDAEIADGATHFVPGSEWTPAQYIADLHVKQWCVGEVRRVTSQDLLRFGIDSLAGHHMFDPVNRKECPGRFWRDQYRASLYAALTGEEPRMIRHNSICTKYQGATDPGGGIHIKPSEFDSPPPLSARMLRLELYLTNAPFIVTDGDGRYAGQVGWDGGRYGLLDVDVTAGEFTLAGKGVLAQIGIVGYWN